MAENTIKEGKIDEVAFEEMRKQVTKGISSDKQMARTTLNFFAEFFSELKKFNQNMETFSRLYILSNSEKLKEKIHDK